MNSNVNVEHGQLVQAHFPCYRQAGPRATLRYGMEQAAAAVRARQHAKGYWCYPLEADCTIPAEYILMTHFMDEVEETVERKLARYLRAQQCANGGWALYPGGGVNVSCSVKAYYALKLCGDDPEAEHMRKAREAILQRGGAARCNVFTRITLALFGQLPWRGVPFIGVEHILLPRWFPFHICKVSYWSRTVLVPLAILYSLKPRAVNPRGVDVRELFVAATERETYFHPRTRLQRLFFIGDRVARLLEPLIPGLIRRACIRRSIDWMVPRLNAEHGLGGIFPAMVNAYEALSLVGYAPDHPYCRQARRALRKLLVLDEHSGYCQPCVSPVWDSALASLALCHGGLEGHDEAVRRCLDWLRDRQLDDAPGDWRDNRPHLRGGGWPFQFANSHYPDLDDTSAVGWAMAAFDPVRYADSIERATAWVRGMQSANGGFGSFDADNTHYYLNAIPFADHGALLDPPTADVTARCIILLALRDCARNRRALERALHYLRREQEDNGSWFGRWGTNYIYGTWSVLTALEQAGVDMRQDWIRRAADWLQSVQHLDGGWGESNDSYGDPALAGGHHASTPYQTAWALLALMAAGERGDSPAVSKGIAYLLRQQCADGSWHDESFTAPGFPRVFYLRYHGYAQYFPLWALARYHDLSEHA